MQYFKMQIVPEADLVIEYSIDLTVHVPLIYPDAPAVIRTNSPELFAENGLLTDGNLIEVPWLTSKTCKCRLACIAVYIKRDLYDSFSLPHHCRSRGCVVVYYSKFVQAARLLCVDHSGGSATKLSLRPVRQRRGHANGRHGSNEGAQALHGGCGLRVR